MATPILIAAGVEPVSLDEIRLWLRDPEPEDNPLILGLVSGARDYFETAMDRQLTTATWELRQSAFPALWQELPYPPLRSVVSIKYDDADGNEQTLATSVYNVVTSDTPGWIELADGQQWPATDTGPEVVRIQFTAGFGDPSAVPELVKSGIKMLVSHWYDNRGDTADVPPAVQKISIAAGAYRF